MKDQKSAKTEVRQRCLSAREISDRLVAAGVRPTAQRIAICQYVLCEADHPSAETIKEWIDERFPMMSLATVYNTLGVLVKAGLLRELRLPHIDTVLYDNNLDEHHHFLDKETGRVYDIEASRVKVESSLPSGVRIEETEILFKGSIKRQYEQS